MTSNFHPASLITLALISVGLLEACSSAANAPLKPLGQEKTTKTEVLEAGAAMLQTDSPLEPMNIYLDGFHASKENPAHHGGPPFLPPG